MAERQAWLALRTGVMTAVALTAAACGRGPSGDEQTGSGPAPPPAASGTPGDGAPGAVRGVLDADVEMTEAGVKVTWTWTNDGAEAVLVGSAAPGNSATLSPTSLYVVGLDDGGVQVGQRLFDQPADDDAGYAVPFRLGVTEVQPGKTVRGRATVPAPLEESKPFPEVYAPGEAPLSDDPTTATLCLGVIAPPFDDLSYITIRGETTVVQGSAATQTLFCADPVDLT